MLKAILSGKSGRIPEGVRAGDSWSTAIKHSEDLLTSMVFERLAYIDASLLWSILRLTFGAPLPNFKVADLISMQFWPNWHDPTTGGTVEPDIFLEFDLGDPVQRISIICEAKLGQTQYAHQWQRQWKAYEHQLALGEVNSDSVFLLAIGGLTGHRSHMAKQFTQNIHTETAGAVQINAIAADWSSLADAIHDQIEISTGADARVLSDISDALNLFGYRHVKGLSSLSTFIVPQDPVGGLSLLKNLEH